MLTKFSLQKSLHFLGGFFEKKKVLTNYSYKVLYMEYLGKSCLVKIFTSHLSNICKIFFNMLQSQR